MMNESRNLYCPNCKDFQPTNFSNEGFTFSEVTEGCSGCGTSAVNMTADEPRCECCKTPETAADDFGNNEGLCKTCWESDPEYIARVGKGELICQI